MHREGEQNWAADVMYKIVELGVFVPRQLALGKIRFSCPGSWMGFMVKFPIK
jgi:hypothetical protein